MAIPAPAAPGAQDYPAFAEHLQSAVDRSRPVLADAAASPATQTWLKPQLDSPEGTARVYGLLENLVAGPGFLARLTSARERRAGSGEHGSEVLGPGWWEEPQPAYAQPRPANLPATEAEGFEQVSSAEAGPPAEPLDSYVMVEKTDVLEAIGAFVAAYLAELPEANNLQPAELQAAIRRTFKELRQSRARQLWGWGRAIYRCVAFSYGAFSVYENPWLVRACLAAVWTAARMMLGLLV